MTGRCAESEIWFVFYRKVTGRCLVDLCRARAMIRPMRKVTGNVFVRFEPEAWWSRRKSSGLTQQRQMTLLGLRNRVYALSALQTEVCCYSHTHHVTFYTHTHTPYHRRTSPPPPPHTTPFSAFSAVKSYQ